MEINQIHKNVVLTVDPITNVVNIEVTQVISPPVILEVSEVGRKGDQGVKGDTGNDGLSAYQIAINNGTFTGTEVEFAIMQASVANKLDKGGYQGTAQDLSDSIQNIYQPDTVIRYTAPTRVGNTFTFPSGGYDVLLSKQFHTNVSELETTIAAATDGFKRIDLVYFKSDNTIAKIEGNESATVAVRPEVPAGGIELCLINVFGATIEVPEVNGAYVQKSEHANVVLTGSGVINQLNLVDEKATIVFKDAITRLNTISYASVPYNGKTIRLFNAQATPVTIGHSVSGYGVDFVFLDGQDYILLPNQTIEFSFDITYAPYAHHMLIGSKGITNWSELQGKPSTFPPSAHTHTVSQITDFPTIQTIDNIPTDGSNNAVSSNGVFDALATKAPISSVHNPVTLGTPNGLSLSTQQLSLGLASSGVTGALSGTDWNTFNNKQDALGFTPENVVNKQNSLAVDGTGTKYPTVDAVNALKWIKSNESLTLAQRKGDVLYGILDQYTGEEMTLSKVIGSPTVDGIIYFQLGSEYFKRNYTDYADARWFGAKGDGIDLGIGNYAGDQEEINQALLVCKKVILKNGVFLVKKPIVLNDENDLFIDVTATLKLGDASNCTLLKNSHVDIYKDANGVPTYPVDFERHKNIKVHGKGLIDFNGWMQNRADDVGASQDNPAVIGTPRFADGLGIGSYYVGWGAKFVDIDNFFFGGGLTVKNARTYTFSCSGLTNYLFDGIISERNYFVQNQDFLNLVGNMYDGIVRNIYGVSGDEFIVISNNQLGDLTLRQGDVKRLLIENITYFGIDPTATPTSQKPMSTFEDGFVSHRLARISYTKSFVVNDITIQNCNATNSKLHAQIVISKLPYSGGVFPAVYDGDGYIGKVTINNVNSPNAEGLLDFGDYTIVKNLIINNIVDRRVGFGDPRGFIANYENFTGEVVDFTNSKIENLTLNNVKTILGGGSNPSQSWIKFAGEIKNLTIDNYNVVTEVGSETDVFWNFLESNVKNLWVSNSDFNNFNKIFDLSNTDGFFFENNSTYRNPKDVEVQVFQRANTSTFVMDSDDISTAINGDIIRTSTGLKMFNGTFWQNLNKPNLTIRTFPIKGIDDLEDSKLNVSGGGYDYNFGNSANTVNVNIHKSAGFFGNTTPFVANYYNGFNLFRNYMDGNYNTVFESIQKGTEQSGFIFRVNSINSLDLRKDGNAYFSGVLNATAYTGGATLTGTPTAPTAPAGTNTTQIATTAFVQDAALPYKLYTFYVNQSGANIPTSVKLSNNTTLSSTPTWERTGVGDYRFFIGTVNTTKVFPYAVQSSWTFGNDIYAASVQGQYIQITRRTNGVLTDGLNNILFEIRQYP